MGDIFDSSLQLEQRFIDEGHAEGVRDGESTGLAEGRDLGVLKGFEVGEEVGFYWGSVQVWRLTEKQSPGFLPERAGRAVSALEEFLRSFPSSPQDERLQDAMSELRGKFKAAVAMLGLNAAYFPDSETTNGTAAF